MTDPIRQIEEVREQRPAEVQHVEQYNTLNCSPEHCNHTPPNIHGHCTHCGKCLDHPACAIGLDIIENQGRDRRGVIQTLRNHADVGLILAAVYVAYWLLWR